MCEYCHQIGNHHPRCPMFRYEPVRYCVICKGGMYLGEEFIKNHRDEYVHYDCASFNDLIKFFDGETGLIEY